MTNSVSGITNRCYRIYFVKRFVPLILTKSIPLNDQGLCLSGCEEETNQLLVETLQQKYPQTAKNYVITSDTVGSFRTGLETSGVVLIAGTGSNALLIDTDGKQISCGGWGYMIGDEGSGEYCDNKCVT